MAVASTRFGTGSAGGVTTRTGHFAKALHCKPFEGVMVIDEVYQGRCRNAVCSSHWSETESPFWERG